MNLTLPFGGTSFPALTKDNATFSVASLLLLMLDNLYLLRTNWELRVKLLQLL